MGVAAQVAARQALWPAAVYAPAPQLQGRQPVTFPATPLRITVELQLGGVWTDISPYVLYQQGITVVRGRTSEQPAGSLSNPSMCKLTLDNTDKRFSPRNISGPYYGLLKRQTPLRVKVNPGSRDYTRFTGAVPDWTPDWTIPQDNTVDIEANGILRRLGQGTPPLQSPLYSTILGLSPSAYWPLEGEAGTTTPINTQTSVLIDGAASDVEWASDSNLAGSKPLPLVVDTTSTISDRIDLNPRGGNNTAWTVSLWWKGRTSTSTFFYTRLMWALPGPAGAELPWELNIGQLAGGAEYYTAFNNSDKSHAPGDAFDEAWHHLVITAAQNGSNVDTKLYVDGTVGTLTSSSAGFTLNALTSLRFLPDAVDYTDTTGWLGHVAVFNRALTTTEISSIYNAGLGHVGETPGERFLRLCAEVGVDGVVEEVQPDTQGMGAQGITDFLSHVASIEAVAEGIVDETFDDELRLSSRTVRYTAPIGMTLDYAQGQLAKGFKVTDDDYALSNDVEITRDGGASFRAEQTDGSLGTDPSTGVGTYADSDTLVLETDAQTGDHAWWRVRKGTVDEQRWPGLTFALHRDPELMDAWLDNGDIGMRIRMINPSANLGSTVDQFVDGYRETFDQFTYSVSAVCSPVSGQNASVYQDMAARYDCAGSVLASGVDSSIGSLSLTVTDNCIWGHDHGDYLVVVDQEQMLVTAVSAGGGSLGAQTQTLTVTRSANGVTQTHSAGAEVHVYQPGRYAL